MTKPQLTKSCIICGLQKPLAAFLQMSGDQGTIYGNVCATCRGSTGKNETIILTEDDSSTSTGLKIDADAKLLLEIKEKKEKKATNEQTREDLIKKDKLILEKNERLDLKQQAERDHRDYIEAKKKQSFLRFQESKPSVSKETIAKQSEETRSLLNRHQEILEKNIKEEAIKEDLQKTTLDLSVPAPVLRTDEIRFQNPIIHSFRKWLGTSAPINKIIEQLKSKENTHGVKENLDPVEHVKKNFPSSKR